MALRKKFGAWLHENQSAPKEKFIKKLKELETEIAKLDNET